MLRLADFRQQSPGSSQWASSVHGVAGAEKQRESWTGRARTGAVVAFEGMVLYLMVAFRAIDGEVNDPLGWTAYLMMFGMANVVGLVPAIGVGHLVGKGIDWVVARTSG
jgi:hypothetical protein